MRIHTHGGPRFIVSSEGHFLESAAETESAGSSEISGQAQSGLQHATVTSPCAGWLPCSVDGDSVLSTGSANWSWHGGAVWNCCRLGACSVLWVVGGGVTEGLGWWWWWGNHTWRYTVSHHQNDSALGWSAVWASLTFHSLWMEQNHNRTVSVPKIRTFFGSERRANAGRESNRANVVRLPALRLYPRTYIIIRRSTPLPIRAQELCESRGGHPGLPVLCSPYSLYGRKTTFEDARGLRESRGGRPGLPGPNTVIVPMVSVDVKQHWTRALPLGQTGRGLESLIRVIHPRVWCSGTGFQQSGLEGSGGGGRVNFQ